MAQTKTPAKRPNIDIRNGYIDTADVAKLIRHQLAQRFPAVKFSVRLKRYAGGSSINVYWVDGPTGKQVEEVTRNYEGRRFDGMIDLAYHVDNWLMPDGSAIVARSPGTTESRGTHAPQENTKPHPDAVRVSFGSSYVFANRKHSAGFLRRRLERIASEYPDAFDPAAIEIETWQDGSAHANGTWQIKLCDDGSAGGLTLQDALHRACVRTAVAS